MLLVDDADADVHALDRLRDARWPPAAGSRPSGQFPAGTKNGQNSAGKNGWTPPCPPEGDDAHTYRFALYAIPKASGLEDGASPEAVREALEGAVGRGTFTGPTPAQQAESRRAPGCRQRVVIDGSLRERTVSVLTAPIMFGAVTSTRSFVPTRSALRASARIETVPRALRLT